MASEANVPRPAHLRPMICLLTFFLPAQKYSRLRCLLFVKGLVIGFYLGWSGHTLLTEKYNEGRLKAIAAYLQQ